MEEVTDGRVSGAVSRRRTLAGGGLRQATQTIAVAVHSRRVGKDHSWRSAFIALLPSRSLQVVVF
jgi:hypothetical protein